MAATPDVRRQPRRATLYLSPEDTLTGDLMLIDARHPVPPEARHARLSAPFEGQPDVLMVRHAASALASAVRAAGLDGRVCGSSGFRTASHQLDLWSEASAARGELGSAGLVARPGASEHEAGLAIDLGRHWQLAGSQRRGLVRRVGERLRRELVKHGFVERYPRRREHVTGMAAEPWHYRFVGSPHSRAMYVLGLTLEEWLALLSAEATIDRPLAIARNGMVTPCDRKPPRSGSWLVASVPVPRAHLVTLPRTRGASYAQVSGTNCGSVVITWPA